MQTDRILYVTDKFGVSVGYEPAFTKLVNKAGLHRHHIVTTHIYNIVDKPLKKRANEKIWRFDAEKLPQIKRAFDQRIASIRPRLIVVSCPAVIGVLAGGDTRLATLEKMRGGVYDYAGVKCIVTYPVTAIHQRVDERILRNDDEEEDRQEPYRVPDGQQILAWDWQKVGRFFHGKQRELPPFRYSVCRTLEDCYAARSYLESCKLVAADIETGNYPPGLTCVGYAGLHESGAVHCFVIPLFDPRKESGTFWDDEDSHLIALAVIRDINGFDNIKTMQNGAYDASYFIRDTLGLKNWFLDSMVLWWSLYMELAKSLDFISSVLLDNYQYWKDDIKGDKEESVGDNLERYWRYNALDCYNTLFNTLYLVTLLQKNPAMRRNYYDAMMRVFSGLRMSMRGLRVDWKRRDYHRENLVKEMEENTEVLRFILDDPDFNINSSDQKASLLYDVMGLRERTARGRFVDQDKEKKGTNARSAGAIPLRMAKSEHPLFKYIIEYLERALEPRVQMSNVFGHKQPDGSIKGGYFMPTGRLRTHYNGVGTETMRYSSKKSNFWDGGNVQNIRGEYKDWLIPDEGKIFLDVDFSQSDDVFISYESQDPDKIAAVESGRDVHAINGELFFGMPYEKIVEGKRAKDPLIVSAMGIRQLSKKIVHGSNFQMAAMTLYVTHMGREATIAAAKILGFDDAESWDQDRCVMLCGRLMSTYRKKYKRLTSKEWYAEVAKTLKDTRQITNCYGLTRSFLGDPNDNGTQREATAFYGQSATSGNMNRVMNETDWGFIPETFRDGANPDAKAKPLIMDWESHGFIYSAQVHDNFVTQLDTRHSRWKEAAHNLLQVMNRPVIIHGRVVRIKAEAEVGLRWGKAMLEWDGKDVHDLDRLVVSLHTSERKVA